jgi:hypothetical protein
MQKNRTFVIAGQCFCILPVSFASWPPGAKTWDIGGADDFRQGFDPFILGGQQAGRGHAFARNRNEVEIQGFCGSQNPQQIYVWSLGLPDAELVFLRTETGTPILKASIASWDLITAAISKPDR